MVAVTPRTLTNLYNQRPTWLAHAHQARDAAVLAAYGWPADLSDDDLLARLLAVNLARVRCEATLLPRRVPLGQSPMARRQRRVRAG